MCNCIDDLNEQVKATGFVVATKPLSNLSGETVREVFETPFVRVQKIKHARRPTFWNSFCPFCGEDQRTPKPEDAKESTDASDLTPGIQPRDIDTSHAFWDTFGKCETEISARYIVRFCQQRGNWSPFTYAEIDGFYQGCGYKDGFWFNGLNDENWLPKEGDYYTISQAFIARCYEKNPAEGGEAELKTTQG